MEGDDSDDSASQHSVDTRGPHQTVPEPATRDIAAVNQELQESIDILKNDTSGKRTFRGKVALQTAYGNIIRLSSEHGVTEQMISDILDIAASGKYADNVCSKLIKSLLPRRNVPSDIVVSAVSWIGTMKPSIQTKSLIIRWLVLIFDLIDDRNKLHALYGPLFFFLQSENTCPYVSHLLYLLTRKEDVLLCRIRLLINLQQKLGPQSHIMGLLSIYKLYCPSIVNIVVPKGRKTFFRNIDRNWARIIQQVQEQRNGHQSMHDHTPVHEETLLSQAKRRRLDIIPDAQTSLMNMAKVTSKSFSKSDPVPIQHVSSFDQLVESMDRIELPSQSGSVLKNPYLQHVVACNPDQIFNTRFQYWLGNTLTDEVLLQPYSDRGEKLLRALGLFAEFLQEGVPVVESFLIKYLNSLHSTRLKPSILNLLKRFRLHAYPVLHHFILEQLRSLFFSSSVYVKCQILVCMTELFQNYLNNELPRYRHSEIKQVASLQKSEVPPDFCTVFQEEFEELKPYDILQDMMTYMLDICGLALQVENSHILLTHCVFNLLDLVVAVFPNHRVPFVLPLPNLCVYHALLANNAMSLSRLCQTMIQCRESYQALKAANIPDDVFPAYDQGLRKIDTFNTFIRNIMDAMWLCRAFTRSEEYSLFKLKPELLGKLDVPHYPMCFSIFRHQALIGFAWDFLRLTQPEDTRVLPEDLKDNASEMYLEFLRDQSLDGIHDFLFTFSRRLSKQTSIAPSMSISAE